MEKMKDAFVYRGEARRCIAFPLGGIGTGTVAVCGDGTLRQWQIWNRVEHRGYLPDSFFAITAQSEGGENLLRALMTREFMNLPDGFAPVPTVDDHYLPEECRALLQAFPCVESTQFVGRYPIAELRYLDSALPVQVQLEAFSPMIPLQPDDSGLPLIYWNFTLKNVSRKPVEGRLVACLQNGVGHVPGTRIEGVSSPHYGGNRNRVVNWGKWCGVFMDRVGQKKGDPNYGEMFVGAWMPAQPSGIVEVVTRWEHREALRAPLEWGELAANAQPATSQAGRTINAAVAVPYALQAGESAVVTFAYAWRFPNRTSHWTQKLIYPEKPEPVETRIGNRYSQRFSTLRAVLDYADRNGRRLTEKTRLYRDTFFSSTLPAPLLDAASSQSSILRTEVCFRTADGRFYGFEGGHGASTKRPDCAEGCCAMTCTHVWNYEMSVSRLYPELARSMREVEFFHQQSEEGYIPHRVGLPLSLPRPHLQEGPPTPALDGMLGAVLKLRREAQRTASPAWARRYWSRLRRLMEYVIRTWDPDGKGLIVGEQPNTYDIATWGPNTFIGSLYLGALAACLDLASALGLEGKQAEFLAACRIRLDAGRRAHDRVWNGEYYQHEEAPAHLEYGWGPGVHSDSLLGQWYAHLLGLGHVLPPDKVKKTLAAIMQHNFRSYWTEFVHQQRVYITGMEKGLLNCSWPRGGRPEKPVPYCDEVWTGIEYEVAALCLYEGLPGKGVELVSAVRHRHSGETRNPWNEVECGDHYVRAMSSWSLLDAASGLVYEGLLQRLRFCPVLQRDRHRAFLITGTGWGTIAREGKRITISVVHGKLRLMQLATDLIPRPASLAVIGPGGRRVRVRRDAVGRETRVAWAPLTVRAGQDLVLRWD